LQTDAATYGAVRLRIAMLKAQWNAKARLGAQAPPAQDDLAEARQAVEQAGLALILAQLRLDAARRHLGWPAASPARS
jgi:hypothetical protein